MACVLGAMLENLGMVEDYVEIHVFTISSSGGASHDGQFAAPFHRVHQFGLV